MVDSTIRRFNMGYTKTMKHLDFGEWIPENLEEAEKKFNQMYGSTPNGYIAAQAMTVILRCRMLQGEEFIKAYENTLKDYLRVYDSKKK
jgi:hypothetical protein